MSDTSIVARFVHAGRNCLVRSSLSFHCGYVETKREEHYHKYLDEGLDCEEPTFSGKIEEKWFIGFDSGHWCDNPSTQSAEAVTERTKKFAEELVVIEEMWDVMGK